MNRYQNADCVSLPKTGYNDRTHEKGCKCFILTYAAKCFFLGKCLLLGSIQADCFDMGCSRRKNQTGEGGRAHTFFEKIPGIFVVFLYTLGNIK